MQDFKNKTIIEAIEFISYKIMFKLHNDQIQFGFQQFTWSSRNFPEI